MTVIARDAVASDHLVYAWPFPLGPDVEVSCADDEQVVMCPAWLVGDRLGPGHHLWRTPDPSRPVTAFFVLTSPVEVSFDMLTAFVIPTTGQPVRMRASGSLQVRCADPGLLIAQFVGLPFDSVNEGIVRSVARSVERMLARLLTRRVVMAGSPVAVTDPGMLGGIIEELVAYNPTAGAVFGLDLMRVGHLTIVADDGTTPYLALPAQQAPRPVERQRSPSVAPMAIAMESDHDYGDVAPTAPIPDGNRGSAAAAAAALIAQRLGGDNISLLETARGRPMSSTLSGMAPGPGATEPPPPRAIAQSSPGINPPSTVSGEIGGPRNPRAASQPGVNLHATQRGHAIEMPRATDEITQPGIQSPLPVPGSNKRGPTGSSQDMRAPAPAAPAPAEGRGAIFGIGMSSIGHSSSVSSGSISSGEIPIKVPPGGRVLVPGPNGLMQSATVRQLLQGYYELEVGHSGETIWVPIGHVVPEH